MYGTSLQAAAGLPYSGSIFSTAGSTTVQSRSITSIMHVFNSNTEGALPTGALVQMPVTNSASNSHWLYGLLQVSPNSAVGGVVYSYNTAAALVSLDWTVSFASTPSNGCTPVGALIIVGLLLYGTMSGCGDSSSQAGTIFTGMWICCCKSFVLSVAAGTMTWILIVLFDC